MTYEISDTVSHQNEDVRGPEATEQFIVELDDACPHAADETDANGYEYEVIHDGRNCYALIELDGETGEYIEKIECCISEGEAIRQAELLTTNADWSARMDKEDRERLSCPRHLLESTEHSTTCPDVVARLGNITDAQYLAQRRFQVIEETFKITVEQMTADQLAALENWATAWAEASK